MDRWTDGRTDSPCILQDIVPFGSTAKKMAGEEQEKEREGSKKRSGRGKKEGAGGGVRIEQVRSKKGARKEQERRSTKRSRRRSMKRSDRSGKKSEESASSLFNI